MPDSSPETVVETTEAQTSVVTQVSDSNVGEPSTPEPKAGMLDAVKSALGQKEASPTSGEPGEKAPNAEADDSKTDKGPPESDELSPEELKALSQRTQQRFKRLTDDLKTSRGEIDTLRPKAEEFDKINQFVSNAGMSNDEVGQLLQIGALMKSNPAKALEAITPYWEALQQHVGGILPADLQQQVQLGYITEQHARELVRAQASEKHTRERAEATEARRRQEAEQRSQNDLVTNTLSEMEKWEAKQAQADPDWHLKRKAVSEKVELAIYKKSQEQGKPWFPDAKEAAEMAVEALKEINAQFKRLRPTPRPINPVTGNASTRTSAAPKSMLDVVRLATAG